MKVYSIFALGIYWTGVDLILFYKDLTLFYKMVKTNTSRISYTNTLLA